MYIYTQYICMIKKFEGRHVVHFECVYVHKLINIHMQYIWVWYILYGVGLVSRLLKIIGLFCKRALWKRRYSAKETYNLKEPTDRSHAILRHAQYFACGMWYIRLVFMKCSIFAHLEYFVFGMLCIFLACMKCSICQSRRIEYSVRGMWYIWLLFMKYSIFGHVEYFVFGM